MSSRLLEGIKVVELGNFVSVPLATLILADLGAEVVKVENTTTGDDSRSLPPFMGEHGFYFVACNRSKTSLALDLKTEQGAETFLKLIAVADVLMVNFRPGVLERLGFTEERLKAVNPKLVSVSVTGFGRDTTHADRAGYDPILQAFSGLMEINRFVETPPKRVPVPVVDISAALLATVGALAALVDRERGGSGHQIDISLLGSALQVMSLEIFRFWATGESFKLPTLDAPQEKPFSPVFASSDGRWIQLSFGNVKFFRALCESVSIPDEEITRIWSLGASRATQGEFTGFLEELFAQHPYATWERLLSAARIPFCSVNSIDDFVSDPEVRSAYFTEVMTDDGSSVPALRTAITVDSELPVVDGQRVPSLDADHDRILREWLGLSDAEIEGLRADPGNGVPPAGGAAS